MWTDSQLAQRGKMAYLLDEIKNLSRQRDLLLQPLRQRLLKAVPPDQPSLDIARPFDAAAALQELKAAQHIGDQLEPLIQEYDHLATQLGFPTLKRSYY
ncbi:MAG: hypothetical protein OHK0012_07580 [Synechococcales cyanobacterium]